MDELYDWAKEEEQETRRASAPYDISRLPVAPSPRLIVTSQPGRPANNYHGPDCWCSSCGGGPTYHQPAPAQSSPLLDKVIALVVAFAAMIVGGLVLIPLIVPLVGLLVLFVVAIAMVVAVVGLVILGMTRAITERPVREPIWRRR